VTPHPNTLQLHQLRYGELTGDVLARVRAHVDACPTCAARLRVQQADRAAFVLRPIPPALRAVEARPARAAWRSLGWGLLAAAVVVLGVRGARLAAPEPGEAAAAVSVIRYRGELPTVEVWARGERGVRALGPGDRVTAGQAVQLKYDPHGASAIAIAGRDGSGTVEVYSTRAPTGIGLVTAPFALTLDDGPGDQELFVVGSDRPLDEAEVRLAITRGVEGARVARVSLARR
jgi:hypothetical protein